MTSLSSHIMPQTSVANSATNVVLAPLAEWVGSAELNLLPDVLVTMQATGRADIYLQFSEDGITWTSSIRVAYSTTSINPPQPRTKGPRYYRTRVVNTSTTSPITITRVTTYYGDFKQLTSDLTSIVPQTFPANVVRPIDFNLMVSKGLYQGHSIVIKDGLNPSISSASAPEDVTFEGGIYQGFPAAAAASEVVSTSASDTGILYFFYLETPDDTDYSFGIIQLNGTTPVPLPDHIFRSNFGYYESGGANANVGVITVRHTANPSTIFFTIPATYGQSYCGAYSVPKNNNIFIDRITSSVRGSTSGSIDGLFYYKSFTGSPRLRFPFEASFGALYFDDVDYSIRVPEQIDMIPRVLFASANNLSVKLSYRLMQVLTL